MTTGGWIVLAAVVLALGFGGWRLLTDGRFRGTRRVAGVADQDSRDSGVAEDSGDAAGAPRDPASASAWAAVAGALPDATPGERATLLQFSSAFCAPCRVTRRTLAEVADVVPGVTHLEVDAEHHLELVRRLGVLRTPTTLVLDARGVEVARAAGAPRREQVLAALAEAVPD